MPLSNSYLPDFDGTGVDVYILDTGLDTQHAEFIGRKGPVKNVYDAYAKVKTSPAADNDMQGHGTHVAGTIGGKTFGIAQGASLLSVRILNDVGQGTVSDIISALEFIMKKKRDVPTIMSMSLGGPCQPSDCTQDPLVNAVQALAEAGVIISVAAGNSACNACSGSPNSAPHAITTGASTIEDSIAFFSNFGQCVDIFAPGYNILSACAKVVCGDEKKYWELSGTSMACPHVTGVIAQLLQRFPKANYKEITKYLTCDATKNRIALDSRDTVSRNLLLQTPKKDTEYTDEYCETRTDQCPQRCNERGICMPLHPHSGAQVDGASGSVVESPLVCQCDPGWYGENCGSNADPICPAPVGHNVKLSLYDATGNGWSYATYSISDLNSRAIVGGAMDSMCFGAQAHHSYCLADGCYQYGVSKGQFPGEIEWKMCGIKGGAPYSGEFCMRAGHCLFQCPDGNFVDITMEDTLGQGWNGAYYEIYTPDGKQSFGGGMLSGDAAVHTLCLPKGCSYVMMHSTTATSTNGDMKYEVCGHRGSTKTVTEICIDDAGRCTTPDPLIHHSCPVAETMTAMYLFDKGGDGWGGATYSLVADSGETVSTGTMVSGFVRTEELCLPDGCYDFSVTTGSHEKEIFWNLCGHRGVAPFESRLCVEKAYDFCYGLSGCPPLKSYLHHSDAQYYFVYHERDGGGYDLDAAGDLHGVHELCELSPAEGCHKLAVGSGKHFFPDEDEHFDLCGSKGTVPATASVCLTPGPDGIRSCNPIIQNVVCPLNQVPQLFAMADEGGDGWGEYYFEIKNEKGERLYKDTLKKGSFDTKGMCLKDGCYDLLFRGPRRPTPDVEEIIWVFCGIVGPAVESIRFCVTDLGCEFQIPQNSGYYYYYGGGYGDNDADDFVDDDFPVDFGDSNWPTPHPTERKIGLPTISERPTTAFPTVPQAPTSTYAPSAKPSISPTLPPKSRPPTVAPTNLFTMLSIRVNVTTEFDSRIIDRDELLNFDYGFVCDAVGKIVENSESGIEIHGLSARLMSLRHFFDSHSDGTHRSLLDSVISVEKKNIAASVSSLKKRYQGKDVVFEKILLTNQVIYQVEPVQRLNTDRFLSGLGFKLYATVEVLLKISNADLMRERDAWFLKDAVDTAILLAHLDGTLQRKLSRSSAAQAVTPAVDISAVRVVGVGVDSYTIPRFDRTQYLEKPNIINFDDDDLFDDAIEESMSGNKNEVDTGAIVFRTNIMLAFLSIVTTFAFVLFVVMIYVYRESDNRMKFALDSLIAREDGVPKSLSGKKNVFHRARRNEVPDTSSESVTVVFNPVYREGEV